MCVLSRVGTEIALDDVASLGLMFVCVCACLCVCVCMCVYVVTNEKSDLFE